MWKLLSRVWLFETHRILQGRILDGVGSCSLLQGIFPTQESNPGLLHCMRILYQLSQEISPRRLVWVAYPFFSGSSWPRNRTGVSRIAGGFFTNWAIREAALNALKETILRKKFPLKKSPHKSSLEDLQYFQVFTPCYIGNKHLPDKNVVASLFLVPLSTPRSSPQAIGIST